MSQEIVEKYLRETEQVITTTNTIAFDVGLGESTIRANLLKLQKWGIVKPLIIRHEGKLIRVWRIVENGDE